jgi:hypothetical protein
MKYAGPDEKREQSIHQSMGHTARVREMRRNVLQGVRHSMEAQRLAAGEAGGRPRSMQGASPPPPLRVKQGTWYGCSTRA